MLGVVCGITIYYFSLYLQYCYFLCCRTAYGIRLALFNAVEEVGFLDQLVEEALLLHQFGGCIELSHCAPVQHNDAVAVKNCVDAVRNGDDGLVLEHVGPQGGLQQCIGLYINGSLQNVSKGTRKGCQSNLR